MEKKFYVRKSNLPVVKQYEIYVEKAENYSLKGLSAKSRVERYEAKTKELYCHSRAQKLLGREPYNKATNKQLYAISKNVALKMVMGVSL